MIRFFRQTKAAPVIQKLVFTSTTAICMCLSLTIIKPALSSPIKQYVYIRVNSQADHNSGGKNTSIVKIYCPPQWTETPKEDAIIVGKFKSVLGNKVLVFKPNGEYDWYIDGSLKTSGVYKVGADPLRGPKALVAVVEGGGRLWVRIDSKDLINYHFFSYKRVG